MVRPTPLRSVVCGPCWAQFGGQAGAEEIGPAPAQAVPARDPAGQAEWLTQLAADPLFARRNRPTRERLLAMARELAYRAGWETFETWPTWPRLMAATGWARSTMAGWLRELRLRGWLITVENGSTPQFRPMARADVEGNRAAVYGLRVPMTADTSRTAVTSAEDKTWTPTHSFDLDQKSWVGGSTRARRIFHSLTSVRAAEQEIEALRARIDEKRSIDWTLRVPTTRGEMLAAAAQLRREHPILARLSPKAVRAEARPYWRAGWCNADVLHALTYRPTAWSSLPPMPAEAVVSPAGWVRSRLGAWRGPRGAVLPGHTDHQAARETIRRRHGSAALKALPPCSRVLTSADVRKRGRQQHAAAGQTLARNHRRDRAEALARPRPPEEVASPQQQRAAVDGWRFAEQQRRSTRDQLVAQARAAHPPAAAAPEPTTTAGPVLPAAASPEEAYERARARAAAERRARGRHRPGWR